jgi:uncharacterized iron-regulated membrane protein
MLLFIGFFGGALTMFKQPLDRWVSAPAQWQANAVPPNQQPDIDRLVTELLKAQPAAREEFTLHLTRQENITAPASWTGAESGHEIDLGSTRWQATLDADGKLAVREARPSLLSELIDMLHRTAGIPGTLGEEYLGVYLMGVAGVMYFLALVSGVVLLLPTLVKDFFALRSGKNRKRFWLDAHNVVGIASLPFHIVISLTVIVFAFHDQFYDSLRGVVYRDQPMFSGPPVQQGRLAELMPASELVARVKREAPEFEVTELLYMGLESPRPMIRAAVVNPVHLTQGAYSGYVMIHPYSGKILNNTMLPTKSEGWSSIVAPFFALHFGSYGGNLVRWLYFFFGLSGAFLFYSGNLLWIEKRRKNQNRNQPEVKQTRATTLMASASVGVCLGCVAGVCFTLVAGKWFHASADNINNTYLWVYYTVFLLSLGWAFWRGPARAAVELLALCALSAAAIPLTSLAALLAPSLGWWAHGSTATLAVDATGLAGALALAYGAWLTLRRTRTGLRDSVWAVPQ